MDVTASMLRSFKSCPKKYYFEYVEQLKPAQTPEALEIGSNYHDYLEMLLTGQSFEVTDLPSAMAEAFDKYIPWRAWNIKEVEKEYRVKIGRGVWLKGKIDAVCADGVPVEHKSSATKADEKYMRRLFLDDQVSCYLLALGIMRKQPVNQIIYTVCAKPSLRPAAKLEDAPEEQAKDLLARQREWFDAEKVVSFTVERHPQEIEDFKQELVYLARSIQARKIFYRNPNACSIMGCPYLPICQDYDPEITAGFIKKERMSEELCRF